MRVEKSDTGYWLYYRANRARFIPFGDPLCAKIEAGTSNVELPSADVVQGGFHQKTIYYRNEAGDICIPPDPSMIPAGFEKLTVKNEREANRLNKEMDSKMREKFGEDHATDFFDAAQGDPRQHLVNLNPKTNYERDMRDYMIKVLDDEERNRERVSVDHHFHWQET